jgi:hypothetical protein
MDLPLVLLLLVVRYEADLHLYVGSTPGKLPMQCPPLSKSKHLLGIRLFDAPLVLWITHSPLFESPRLAILPVCMKGERHARTRQRHQVLTWRR